MGANYSEPGSKPGGTRPQQAQEAQFQQETTVKNGHLQIDPQQTFREYGSSGALRSPTPAYPPAPPATPWPTYPPVGTYPPVYHGGAPGAWQQPMRTPQPGEPSAGYPAYPGYYSPYPGQMYPDWPQVPARPKRDVYLLVIAIVAFICSCLVILGGLGSWGVLALITVLQALQTTPPAGASIFSVAILLVTFGLAGVGGGGFGVYHSMRTLFFRKPSRHIWLPHFWIFLLCYLATVGLGFWLHTQGIDTASPPLLGLLIYLGGIFPALTILALGIRRLSLPRLEKWPTTWRRLTLALVSGATLSIGLALILELLLGLLLLGSQGSNILRYFNDPNSSNPSPAQYVILLIAIALIAPLVEELVKPLAVVALIGRVESKAEAFALGLACGIGFNLVETTLYISQGNGNWLNVALVRSGSGLLHGFGAAMVALGWYILTHREEGRRARRILLAFGCGGYAVLQHALWNGSLGLALIPGPIGMFFSSWRWSAGPLTIDGPELANIVEVIAILIFFFYMTGRLRARKTPPGLQESDAQPATDTPVRLAQAR